MWLHCRMSTVTVRVTVAVMMVTMTAVDTYILKSIESLDQWISLPEDVVLGDTPASFSSFFTPPSWRGRDSAPAACMHACGNNLITASRFSLAPFGDPGRVMMIDCFRVPATGLAISATSSHD